eukprot:TRINITY_DN1458_c0_g1_i1.p1 TRINITY_DN1458_c0_g1~~TRINITY_DN1458_c0_g1_i1.p1  ORF type:complete len:54 (-),score=4.52 TRINITY_DN1458_c0_g1_i1:302-463(-)
MMRKTMQKKLRRSSDLDNIGTKSAYGKKSIKNNESKLERKDERAYINSLYLSE